MALGYDSYLVMRHGIKGKNNEPKLGCYFCNDVVAPGNVSTTVMINDILKHICMYLLVNVLNINYCWSG